MRDIFQKKDMSSVNGEFERKLGLLLRFIGWSVIRMPIYAFYASKRSKAE